MITVEEALPLVLANAAKKRPETVSVSAALGLVLAEDIICDLDSPPWDKSMVDGYAVRCQDFSAALVRLQVAEEVVAGTVASSRVGPGTCIRMMTGAPLPEGCDAVVMVEKSRVVDATAGREIVELEDSPRPGQNVLRRATAARRGDVVLRAGQAIRPIEIGLLAELGRGKVRAVPRARVAVISTGNEIVPPDRVPGPGQIRNSNGPLLAAAICMAGGDPIELGIAEDTAADLRSKIAMALEADIAVLSGGVSAGVLDLVPRVLSELGVAQVFHKLRLKPGKPLWFGVRDRGGSRTLVFGLPGNPVSSLVCFELFVRPAIAALAGRNDVIQHRVSARLTSPFQHRGDRPTYHPAVLHRSHGMHEVTPLTWQGSADLFALARANALAHFPAGDASYDAGNEIEVLEL